MALSVAKTTGSSFGLLGKLLKLRIILIFLFFILLNSVIIGINAKDPFPAISYLGEKFITPTLSLHELSLQAISNKGLYQKTENFYIGIFAAVSEYGELIGILYIMLLWFTALAWIWMLLMLDTSKKPFAYILGILTFFIAQSIYLSYIGEGDITILFIMLKDFVAAVPYFIVPFVDFAEQFTHRELSNNSSV